MAIASDITELAHILVIAVHPLHGATNFHGGIDIPAPPGTNIIAAISGRVTYTGFMGSGGCTVVVQGNNYSIVCHHVSPNFLVSKRRLYFSRSNYCSGWS